MNYSTIYQNLIKSAQCRSRDPMVLYDKHHIVPKSLGGSDDPNNLVYLTLREHFVAHRLLVKIHQGSTQNYSKMIHALWWMCKTKYKQESSIVSSYIYLFEQNAVDF